MIEKSSENVTNNEFPLSEKDIASIRDQNVLMSVLCQAIKYHQTEIVQKLIRNPNFDVNFQDRSTGDSALHLAISFGDVDTVQILVNHPNVDLSCMNFKGITLRRLVNRSKNHFMIEILESAQKKMEEDQQREQEKCCIVQ